MKILLKNIKFYKILIFTGVFIYISCIFVNQQKCLNSYKNEQEYLSKKIAVAIDYKDSLSKTKDNINSLEYIETVARKNLEMYLPNERVYFDNIE